MRRTTAFTLIELMVVLLIITLVASIIVPAVNHARDVAKAGASRTLVFALDSALETYRMTSGLQNLYPPSFIDTGICGNPYMAANQLGSPAGAFEVWGAQTLVWGLMGADLLGTPGFGAPLDSLYALDLSGRPTVLRYPAFLDAAKMRIPRVAQSDALPMSAGESGVRVFADASNMPVLYYLAQPMRTPIYLYGDNDGLTTPYCGSMTLAQRQAWLEGIIEDPRQFQITGFSGPYNRDRFILLSAGTDKLYGTDDDIGNFNQ